ncbi:MAG: ribosome assembly RNA-binding protein YhbY [Pseudomonadota bacterium]
MSLNNKQRSHLKQQAHALKPVVMLGQHGLTDAVVNETEQALEAHELIKVRINAGDRDTRAGFIEELTRRTGAEPVQTIGRVAILYRPPRERPARLKLPR